MQKQKYYGFDGQKFVLIGEFENCNDALESSDEFFYVTSLQEWQEIFKSLPAGNN